MCHKHIETVTKYEGEKREDTPFYLNQRIRSKLKKTRDDIKLLPDGYKITITCVNNKKSAKYKYYIKKSDKEKK